MNFFVDAYHFLIMAISYVILFPFTEGVIVSFICLFVMKKMGATKFLWIKMLSLTPVSDRDEDLKKSKKYRLFNDVFYLTLIFVVFFRVPLWAISQKFLFHKDIVYERTDSAYKLERDEWLEASLMAGLPLFPYVWIPIVVGINKYRQWVDIETMVTWKYHDERRQCFWSGYKDSCGYAMDMARALYRDDESLKIGLNYVEANKNAGRYNQCYGANAMQYHAEETRNVEMYKKWAKRRCELGCSDDCWRHKHAQSASDSEIRMKFQSRAKPSSFITKYE